MKALKSKGLFTSVMLSAALLASPLAMADHHRDRDGHHGKRHHNNICEKMNSGDWEQKHRQMREKYSEQHTAMAERMQLTDKQREIWDEIRDERRQAYQQRVEKLKERCENKDGE